MKYILERFPTNVIRHKQIEIEDFCNQKADALCALLI
jgi:hypothetical protein